MFASNKERRKRIAHRYRSTQQNLQFPFRSPLLKQQMSPRDITHPPRRKRSPRILSFPFNLLHSYKIYDTPKGRLQMASGCTDETHSPYTHTSPDARIQTLFFRALSLDPSHPFTRTFAGIELSSIHYVKAFLFCLFSIHHSRRRQAYDGTIMRLLRNKLPHPIFLGRKPRRSARRAS